MTTKHDVNFRADGSLEADVQHNTENGNSCLTIKSNRQQVQIILTGDQLEDVHKAILGTDAEPEPDMDNRVDNVLAPAANVKKTTKKKVVKKKAAKKSTKKKGHSL